MRGRPEVYRTLWTDGQDCQNQGLTTSHRPKTILFTQSISSLIPKMSVFTLAIACLTKSYLTWFIELTFQIPMQYCSLQHQALLSPTDTSFSSYFSTLPQYQIGHLPAWVTHLLVLSFCLFILFMGFSRQEHWNGLPLRSPCSQRWKSSIQLAKTRLGADCVSDHELIIAKFRIKLNKVWKTTMT